VGVYEIWCACRLCACVWNRMYADSGCVYIIMCMCIALVCIRRVCVRVDVWHVCVCVESVC